MPSEKTTRHFDHYFRGLVGPGHALALVGPWGSGKTTFARAYLKKYESTRRINFISVSGLQSQADIDRAIIESIVPFLRTKLGVAASVGIPVAFEAILQHLNAPLKEPSSNFSPKEDHGSAIKILEPDLLVFDDIERFLGDISILLARICSFVETRRKQCLLILDPAHFETQTLKTYELWKNKFVGRTVTIDVNAEAILQGWLEEQTSDFRMIAENALPVIREVFEKNGGSNLRILRQSIDDLTSNHEAIDWKAIPNYRLPQIIRASLAVGMRYKLGQLSDEILACFAAEYISARVSRFPSRSKEVTEKPLPNTAAVSALLDANETISFSHDGISSETFADLVKGEASGSPELNALIRRQLGQNSSDEPLWKTFWNWPMHKAEEIVVFEDQLRNRLEHLEIKDPGEILHFASCEIDMSVEQASNLDQSVVASKWIAYIKRASDAGVIPPLFPSERHTYRGQSPFDHGLRSKTNEHFQKVDRALEDSRLEIGIQHISKAAKKAEEALRLGADAFIDLLREIDRENESLARSPMLSKLTTSVFVQALLQAQAKSKWQLSRVIADKIASTSFSDRKQELDWLAAIIRDAEDSLSGEVPDDTVSRINRSQSLLVIRDLQRQLDEEMAHHAPQP